MNKKYDHSPGETGEPHPGGQFIVYKTRSGRTLLANKPHYNPDHGPKPAPGTLQEAIRRGVTYADFAAAQNIYQYKAVEASVSAYNLALTDYFGKPQILDIDIHGWIGGRGQELRIMAKDNFLVLRVCLTIRDRDFVWETGEATQSESNSLLWTYFTRTPVLRKAGLRLEAYAYDLPGNVSKYHLEID